MVDVLIYRYMYGVCPHWHLHSIHAAVSAPEVEAFSSLTSHLAVAAELM